MVAVGDLRRTLDEMEVQLEVATALCQQCRSVNLFPGLSRVEAFVCQTCGKENGQNQTPGCMLFRGISRR
jgi:hypothetical protein